MKKSLIYNWWLGGVNRRKIYVTIGDSITFGRSVPEVAGPTPNDDTVFEYYDNNLVEVTNDDLTNVPGGSDWPAFGIAQNAATGSVIIICNSARGGATITNVDDFGRIWSDSSPGSLYADMKDLVDSCLTLDNVELAGFFISGGVNDLRDAVPPTIPQYLAAYEDLIDRINTDFNNPKIRLYQLVSVDTGDEQAVIAGRVVPPALAELYPNVELAINTLGFKAQGLVSTDNVHMIQEGNNKKGQWLSRYLNYPSSYSKYVKGALNKLTTQPTGAKLAAWVSFVNKCVDNGMWDALDALQIYVAENQNNSYADFAELVVIEATAATFTANAGYETNGTDNQINTGFTPAFTNRNFLQDDCFIGFKTGDNKSAASGAGMGTTFGGNSILIQQTGTSIGYRINDNTATTWAGEGVFEDQTYYMTGRSGTTKFLYKDENEVASAVQASVGLIDSGRAVSLGARRNGSTVWDLRLNCQFEVFYAGSWSKVGAAIYAEFLDDLEELLSVLKT